MNIEEIHFHDSLLVMVTEDTKTDELHFEVDYPTDWENNIFEKRTIIFTDILNYQVCEGPFHGPPTILDVSIVSEDNRRKKIRIETNAGYRMLDFKDIILKK